jgi:hypothetical protein
MKKYLILVLALCAFVLPTMLYSPTAEAGGKVTFQMQTHDHDEMQPSIGLSIYESLLGPIYLNSWIGTGWSPNDSWATEQWFAANNFLEVHLWRLTLGVGHKFEYNVDVPYREHNFAAKVAYNIW